MHAFSVVLLVLGVLPAFLAEIPLVDSSCKGNSTDVGSLLQRLNTRPLAAGDVGGLLESRRSQAAGDASLLEQTSTTSAELFITYGFKTDPSRPSFLSETRPIFSNTIPYQKVRYSHVITDSTATESESETSMQYSISVGISGSYSSWTGKSFSAAASMSMNSINNNHVQKFRVDRSVKSTAYQVSLATMDERSYVRSSVKTFFEQNNPDKIIEKYGMFYASKLTLGGVYKSTFVKEKSAGESKLEFEAYVKAKGDFMVTFDVETSVNYSSYDRSMASKVQTNYEVQGGNSFLWTNVRQDNIDSIRSQWVDSITDSNLFPTSHKLKPIWLLIENQAKADAVKAYCEQRWKQEFEQLVDYPFAVPDGSVHYADDVILQNTFVSPSDKAAGNGDSFLFRESFTSDVVGYTTDYSEVQVTDRALWKFLTGARSGSGTVRYGDEIVIENKYRHSDPNNADAKKNMLKGSSTEAKLTDDNSFASGQQYSTKWRILSADGKAAGMNVLYGDRVRIQNFRSDQWSVSNVRGWLGGGDDYLALRYAAPRRKAQIGTKTWSSSILTIVKCPLDICPREERASVIDVQPEYRKLGDGGCRVSGGNWRGNGENRNPGFVMVSGSWGLTPTKSDCQQLCDEEKECTAYEYCTGNAGGCESNCRMLLGTTGWDSATSYTSAECYAKEDTNLLLMEMSNSSSKLPKLPTQSLSELQSELAEISSQVHSSSVFMRYGFKADSERPGFVAETNPIFNELLPVSSLPYQHAITEYVATESEAETATAFAMDADLNVNYNSLFKSFSVAASFSMEKLNNNNVQKIRVDELVRATSNVVTQDLDSYPLDHYLMDEVKALFNSNAKPEDIVAKVGEFYAFKLELGAIFQSTFVKEKTSSDSKMSFQSFVEASGKYLWSFEMSASLGVSMSTSNRQMSQSTKCAYEVQGGETKPWLELNSENVDSIRSTWSSTLTPDNLFPTDFSLVPIWTLVSLANPTKGQEIKDYLMAKWSADYNNLPHNQLAQPAMDVVHLSDDVLVQNKGTRYMMARGLANGNSVLAFDEHNTNVLSEKTAVWQILDENRAGTQALHFGDVIMIENQFFEHQFLLNRNDAATTASVTNEGSRFASGYAAFRVLTVDRQVSAEPVQYDQDVVLEVQKGPQEKAKELLYQESATIRYSNDMSFVANEQAVWRFSRCPTAYCPDKAPSASSSSGPCPR